MINFNFQKEGFELDVQSTLKKWLKLVIKQEGKETGEIQYIFADDATLHDINITYLDHDTLTDIITFGSSNNPGVISGEIYISVDRVAENAELNEQEFDMELSRVMVHGILHLIGYDDHTADQKLRMRAREDYYLNLQP